jgi:hypothetical protein
MKLITFLLVAVMTCAAPTSLGTVSDKPPPESKTDLPQDTVELQAQVKASQQHIAKLEQKLKMLQGEEWPFPGLRLALSGMPGLCIYVKELPLVAVRHGLTKKNIIEAVKARFKLHNIRVLTSDEVLELLGSGAENYRFSWDLLSEPSPQLNVEVWKF